MQWKNPDGSLTEGVVVEDGAGNKLGTASNPLNVTGLSGGGGAIAAAAGAFAAGALVDGADITQGTKSDAIATVASGSAGTWSVVSLLKQVITTLQGWLNFNIGVGGAAVSSSNPVAVFDGYQSPVAVNWTNSTTVNTAQTVATSGMDTVIVTLVANANVTGGAVTFEVYDGATWLPVKAPTIIDYTTVGSVIISASFSKGFQVPVAGFPQFRIRLSTALAGTGASLTVTAIVSSAPDVSLVTVGLDPAQPLPVGSNVIGGVTQSGAWNIGTVTTLPALPAGSNNIGSADCSVYEYGNLLMRNISTFSGIALPPRWGLRNLRGSLLTR